MRTDIISWATHNTVVYVWCEHSINKSSTLYELVQEALIWDVSSPKRAKVYVDAI